jgi:hypothetical protein
MSKRQPAAHGMLPLWPQRCLLSTCSARRPLALRNTGQWPSAAQCWCCPLRMTKPRLQRCPSGLPRWPCCHPPPTPLHMWAWSFPPRGGAHTQHLLLSHHCLAHQLQSRAPSGKLIATPNLVIALVDSTVLASPVLLMRPYPPTLIQLWRGFQCQQCHLSCWQEQLHARGHHHLSLH